MFGGKKNKRFAATHEEAMAKGLEQLGVDLRAECDDLLAGNEQFVAAEPAVITGPAGVENDEWDADSWGWMVLTTKRLQFRRLDYDRVRVAFLQDLNLDSTSGNFDNYRWQDKAQLRNISFGFEKKPKLRTELTKRSGS